jgi:hypothetical protein
MSEMKKLLYNFYTTDRCSFNVSDGGGPFGFDIHHALEIDYLIKKYQIEKIVETGTNMADTTEYLAKNYPKIKIVSSETNRDFFNFSKKRLISYSNVFLLNQSSEKVVSLESKEEVNTLYYLDAHWEQYWPLKDEIENISSGVVCVGDFNINHYSYGFDYYNNIICDENLIRSTGFSGKIYTNNPYNLNYPFPLLQKERLGGRAYFCKNIEKDFMEGSQYFRLHN